MIKPTASRLLVKIVPEEVVEVKKKKDGSNELALPVIKGNAVLRAEVIDVGPDVKYIGTSHVVIFSPYGFDEVELHVDGLLEKFVIIQEDMILAYDNKGKNTDA